MSDKKTPPPPKPGDRRPETARKVIESGKIAINSQQPSTNQTSTPPPPKPKH